MAILGKVNQRGDILHRQDCIALVNWLVYNLMNDIYTICCEEELSRERRSCVSCMWRCSMDVWTDEISTMQMEMLVRSKRMYDQVHSSMVVCRPLERLSGSRSVLNLDFSCQVVRFGDGVRSLE